MLPPFLSSIVKDVNVVLNQVKDDFIVVKNTTIYQVTDYKLPPTESSQRDEPIRPN
jgi:hypothetical protein